MNGKLDCEICRKRVTDIHCSCYDTEKSCASDRSGPVPSLIPQPTIFRPQHHAMHPYLQLPAPQMQSSTS